jgi:hypothetical protein
MSKRALQRRLLGITAIVVGLLLLIRLGRALSIGALMMAWGSKGFMVPIIVATVFCVLLIRHARKSRSAAALSSVIGYCGALLVTVIMMAYAVPRFAHEIGRRTSEVLSGGEWNVAFAMLCLWIAIGAFPLCWSVAVVALSIRDAVRSVPQHRRVTRGMKLLAALVLGVFTIEQIVARLVYPLYM